MRGNERTVWLTLSYVDLKARVRADYPLGVILDLANSAVEGPVLLLNAGANTAFSNSQYSSPE